MAINLETAFATVVHTAPPRAQLRTAFASVVHTAPPRAQLRTAFATVVHGEAPPPPPPPPVLTRRSRLRVLIEGVQPPPAPFTNQARVRPMYLNREIKYGNGDDEFTAMLAASGTIASGGTTNIDVYSGTDVFGVALDLADAALVFVQCVSGSAGSLIVRASAASGWTSFIGTAGDLQVPAGASFVMMALEAGTLTAGAGDSALELEATGGDAEYVVVVWGRRA